MEIEPNSFSPSSEKPRWQKKFVIRALEIIVKGGIKGYKTFVSPLLPPACRFFPTCSEYALQAITKYGPFKGSFLALKRISRCHPYHPGGYDPVP